MPHRHHPDTLLAHAGCTPDPITGSLILPPVLTSTYERAADGTYPGGFIYARTGNPTRAALEETLSALEGGDAPCETVTFGSGMAAVHAVLQSLPNGSHVILPNDVYYGVRALLGQVFEGTLSFTSVEMSDLAALDAALTPQTRLVWAETPSNPMLHLTDLAALAQWCAEKGVWLAVDGTWTTPLLQRPLDLGADVVVHSLTKYMAGHSDILGGSATVRAGHPLGAKLRAVQHLAGPVLDPFSCWLTLRGLRTLHVRLARQCETAAHVAAFLSHHPRVSRVHYPGLLSHPAHTLAVRQMAGFGGMLSFEVAGSRAQALGVAASTRVLRQATSLGGTESLIEHRASVEGILTRAPETLLRVSIGLEHAEDLMADLNQALLAQFS